MTLKPAILLLWKGSNLKRAMVFDDHNDAVDTAERFEQTGHGWSMYSFEHYEQGQMPEDAPPLQKKMFSENVD